MQISDYESEKISAARSGFAPRLNEAKKLIEQYTAAKAEYDQKVEESSEIIESVRKELRTLDEALHTLRPGLKLDTLENRCMGEWVYGEWGMGNRCMEEWVYGGMIWDFGVWMNVSDMGV